MKLLNIIWRNTDVVCIIIYKNRWTTLKLSHPYLWFTNVLFYHLTDKLFSFNSGMTSAWHSWWRQNGTMENFRPSIQKYLENGWVSSSAPLLLLHAFSMLDSVFNMNTISQMQTTHRLVQHVSLILRLCNDSATHMVSTLVSPPPCYLNFWNLFSQICYIWNNRMSCREEMLHLS